MNEQPLEGQVAIVTGGGRGLGRAESSLLAAQGATVVVNDPGVSLTGEEATERPADEVVSEIVAAGGRASASYADCADWDQAAELVGSAIEEHGRLDVLVNSAGILRERMIFNMDETSWREVVRVHLDGHTATLKPAAAYWRHRFKTTGEAGGRVINTTSEAGLYGATGQSNYVGAKAAIAALTLSAARELAPYGVCVNAIAPRAATRMTAQVVDSAAGSAEELTAETMDAADVAHLVAYLAGPEGAAISGQVLVVRSRLIEVMETWQSVATAELPGAWTQDGVGRAVAAAFDGRSRGPAPLPW